MTAADERRMARVLRLLREIVGQQPTPPVRLVNWGTLALIFSRGLWIERLEADEASDPELRGMLAHELAHLRDPYRRREQLAAALLLGVSIAAIPCLLLMPAIFGINSVVWPPAAFAVVCVTVLAARLYCRRSRRCEYRADALATTLASAPDVEAMLLRLERRERTQRRRRAERLGDRLLPTHPPVESRLEAVRSGQQLHVALSETAEGLASQ
jgi:Zn-dependent protease with chaperone function